MCFCRWTFVGASSRRRVQLPARCSGDRGSRRGSSNRARAPAEPRAAGTRLGEVPEREGASTPLPSAAPGPPHSSYTPKSRRQPWPCPVVPGADAAPLGRRFLPGVGSWWWHGDATAQHHPVPMCQSRGVNPIPPVGPGVPDPPRCAPRFLPGCESHRPVQEPLHLKGHRALKSVARGGKGRARTLPASLCQPVPSPPPSPARAVEERCCRWVVTAHGAARATGPLPAPRRGSSRTVPKRGDGGKPRGSFGTPRADSLSESPRPAE